jgi:hypothetical protein
MPGSFPNPPAGNITADFEQVKGAAGSALHTARGYVPAVDQVKETAGSALVAAKEYMDAAGDKVAPYLPEQLAAYIPSHNVVHPDDKSTSKRGLDVDDMPSDGIAKLPEERRQEVLPSHDDESFTPLGKTGGVGPLPGSALESGVAILPDERQSDSSQAKSSVPIEQVFSGDAVAKLPEERRQAVLPSHDDASSTPLGKTAGAGHLPGRASEAGVAVLPDQKPTKQGQEAIGNYPNYLNPDVIGSNKHTGAEAQGTSVPERNVPIDTIHDNAPSTHGQSADRNAPFDKGPQYSTQASTNASTKTLRGSIVPSTLGGSESTRAKVPDAPGSHVQTGDLRPPVPDKPNAHVRHIDSDRATAGHSPNTSPVHPATKDAPFNRLPKSTNGTSSASAEVSSPTDDRQTHFKTTELGDDAGSPKKPGFMDKIKGEMKVMSGKLGGNEQKVEEGRKIMGRN